MSQQKIIIFDQNSTSTESGTLQVAPGFCIQLNAWNLAPTQSVCVQMVRMGDGRLGTGGDSCTISSPSQSPASLDTVAYMPCGVPLCMNNTHNMIVLRTPGTYRLTLTPAALGTAVVEATISDSAEGCAAAGSECCCIPSTGAEIELCALLNNLPGGTNDPGDVFVALGAGGDCKLVPPPTVTVDICAELNTIDPGVSAVGDRIVTLSSGGLCKLVPPAASVDICDALIAFPAATPALGDTVFGQKAAACSEFTISSILALIDTCALLNTIPGGVSAVGDVLVALSSGGACKLIPPPSSGVTFPLLAPNGSCLAPSYSFAASPTSGMWFDPATGPSGSVVISDNNCANRINVGASVAVVASTTNISLSAVSGTVSSTSTTFTATASGGATMTAGSGAATVASTSGNVQLTATAAAVNISAATSVGLTTNGSLRITWEPDGSWNVGGTNGTAGQALVSNGAAAPPTWQNVTGTVAEPNTQVVYGTGAAVDSSSFMFYDVTTGQYGLNEDAAAAPLSFATAADVNIRAASVTTGTGRQIVLSGGNTTDQNGGQATMRGGNGGPTRNGGDANVLGGNSGAGGGGAKGGAVNITSGVGTDLNNGPGNINILLSATPGGAGADNSQILLQAQGGGSLTLSSNPSQFCALIGGSERFGVSKAQDAVIVGGTAAGAGINAGNALIGTGQAGAGGAKGRVRFTGNGLSALTLGDVTGRGDWILAGYGDGTGPGSESPLPLGTTSGFTWLPRIAAAPTGVPAPGPEKPTATNYANPLMVQEVGATLVLWGYTFGTPGWRSITLT